MIRILTLDRAGREAYGPRLQALEAQAEYAYGEDRFRLDHGPSYFAFFDRLGEPTFKIALDGARVVACAAGILRRVPTPTGWRPAWYLCDLKVHPEYRARRLPARLMSAGLWRHWWTCPRAYAVSMNPAGIENPMVRIGRKFRFVPITAVAQLNIYGFDREKMVRLEPDLVRIVGPISYLSLEGKKDLILRSTGRRLPLLHVQHGPMAGAGRSRPRPDATHMICAVPDSTLDRRLSRAAAPSATASVLAHRMAGVDFGFVLTSDV